MTGKKWEYWAWKDSDGNYHHIYPGRLLVEMCSPDGFERAVKDGEGKIVKVHIEEEPDE